jgi:hypothetical protein
MKSGFSSFEIIKALDILRDRFREWQNKGFISATIPAPGQGIPAIYSAHDAHAIALFKTMVEAGFNRTVASDYVEKFKKREMGEPDYQKTTYILFRESAKNGEKIKSVSTFANGNFKIDLETGAMDQMKMLSQFPRYEGWADKDWRIIHIINFGALCREVDEALEKL